jgi:hypothetical protein
MFTSAQHVAHHFMDTWPFLTSFLLKATVGMELQFGLARVIFRIDQEARFLLNRELFALKEPSATAILHSNHSLSCQQA